MLGGTVSVGAVDYTGLFHAMPAAVVENEDGVDVTLCTKTGLSDLEAVPMAGLKQRLREHAAIVPDTRA